MASSFAPEAEVVPCEPRMLLDIISDLTEEWYDNQDFFTRPTGLCLAGIHVLQGGVRRVEVWRLCFDELERLNRETVLTKRDRDFYGC